ncbi:uncharacterized protein LOC136072258 [Hydra vulgaris]|uniref:uncharacterized protein LOC136072258 n=1 Tax=Hydra vulgaris TaxID=6087 RepID=UPI0032EA18BF
MSAKSEWKNVHNNGDIEDITISVIKHTDYSKKTQKAIIANNLCVGCGNCVKVCPFNAITIVNLPKELTLDKQLISFGNNSFRIYKRPYVKKGSCIGIIGSNELGKSTTIIKILSGDIKININEKKKLFGGSELYSYLCNFSQRYNKNKL